MILKEKSVKRLGIFYLKDKDGIFDSSYAFLVKKIKPNLEKLIAVYSGSLNDKSIKELSKYADIILKLEKGYRPDGYKIGIDSLSEKEKSSFDEIIFFDNSLIGPFYSLNKMFKDMNLRDVDFWGLNWFFKHESNTREQLYYKKRKPFLIPSFLPWSFFAIRKSTFTNSVFKKIISQIKPKNNEGRSDLLYNIMPTLKLTKSGLKCDSYLSTEDLEEYAHNPLLTAPYICLKEKKSPFLYSELFYMDMAKTLEFTLGQTTIETFEYIKNELDYDINLIWDNILRVANQHDIKNALGLTYMLSSDHDIPKSSNMQKQKVALCMHLYYPDLFDYCLNYAKSMPKETHVFITTNNIEKKNEIEKVFSVLDCEKFEVRVIGNRGRDVSSLLIGCRDVVENYDVICYAHDKKTSQFSPYCVGETFSYQCFENVLKNQHYVNNVIRTFADNPRLGILSPTIPFHANLFASIGREWILNYDNTVNLAKKCGIDVLINDDKPPLAPLGTMFWFRGKALLALCNKNLKYEDFPEEPNDTNGTLLHAYERLYPYAAQNEGYYAGHILADTYATLQMNAQYHMLRSINSKLLEKFGLKCDNYNKVIRLIDKKLIAIPDESLYKIFKTFIIKKLDPNTVTKIKELKNKVFPKRS